MADSSSRSDWDSAVGLLASTGTEVLQDDIDGTPSTTSPSTSSGPAAQELPDAFIRAMPKTDIHVHLDGSVRLQTLIELSREQGQELPAYTEEGLREKVFKTHYEVRRQGQGLREERTSSRCCPWQSLEEYLQGFTFMSGIMQTPSALERVAYEFAVDNYSENVFYFEVCAEQEVRCV